MAFSMSGEGFASPYNRFDMFENALMGEHCDCPPKCDCEKCTNKDGTKKSKKDAKPDFLDLDKDGDKEEDMKDAVAEGYEDSKRGEVIGALNKKKGDFKKKYGKDAPDVMYAVADKTAKKKGDTSKSDDRYAYESYTAEGYQRNPEKGEKEDKKYAPVRGEKTPMPPRGNKRREDFEKWYAQNVKEDADLSIFNDAEVEALEELYKGKHGQSDAEYQDSRSAAGKMISGDSKGSGANYSYKAKNTGPNAPGGSERPQGQARMNNKDRAYLQMQKGRMVKKEDYGYSEVYENRMAAYTAGESEKGSRGPAKVTGGKTIDIKDLPKLKEPSAEEKAKARKALGLKSEETEHDKEVAKHRAAAKKKVDMPAGDVGHDIHDRAVKAYNKRNPSKSVKNEEVESVFSAEELDALSTQLGEDVASQLKASREYFAKRNARSPEEKEAEEKADAKSRAERGAMHKKPDPYKARAGESD